MKKTLLSLITITFFLCEASFTGGGIAFAGNNVGDTFDYDSKYTCTIITTAPTNLLGKPTSNGTVSIKAKSGATLPGALSIPSTTSFSGTFYTFSYDVVTIEANGFKGKTSITSLTIPNSVTTIGSSAFQGCTGLTTVTIGSGVTTLPTSVFQGCTSLTKVGSTAGTITFPSNVTTINGSAFKGCTAMTTLVIPNTVTSLGTSVFEGCTSLASISFSGTSVTSWPSSMCKGCTSLSKVGTTAGRVAVYSAVTSIGSSAFEGCTSINSVVFSGTNVTTLAASVFKGCTSLTQMGNSAGYFTIPNSITTINESAFANCIGITKLTIGTGVTTLNSAAFTGCTNISTVTWNATKCTSSYNSTANPFSASKDKITSFTFGSSVTRIPAFLCYQLTEITSVTIPQSVTFAGGGAFGGCSKLTNVVWNAANCADFTRSYSSGIPTYSSPFCQGAASGTLIKASNLTTITFGPNVTKVPADMCIECKNLKVVTWEAGSATIGSSAFSGCNALKSIIWNKTNCADFASASATPFYSIRTQIESFTFKNNVTLIPAYLCDGMTNLKQVSLPSTVTTVGKNAFNSCIGIEVFACAKATAPTAAASSFTDVPCCLTVPTDSWDSYKDATGWSHFNNAGCSNAPSNIVRGTCGAQGKNLVWELDLSNGEMTISGTGEMANYTNSAGNHAPWYDDYRLLITNVTIEEGATSIGDYAFHNCRNTTFSIMPSSLVSIGKEAFWYCYAASEFNFAENSELTTIGKWAFENCTTLVSITIPEEVTTFNANDAFTGCNALTTVVWNARHCNDFTSGNGPFNSKKAAITSFTFGDAVEYIPAYLCDGMNNASFTSIAIPENVTSINANAFNGCANINSVTWNAINCANFTSGEQPFSGIKANIQSFTFGNSVEHIPAYLCYGMENEAFTSVTIPQSVTSMGSYVFSGCSSINSITWNAENCAGFSSYSSSPFNNIRANITSVTFGNAVKHIPANLCYYFNNNDFNSVTIPASVDSIGQYAFYSCSKLTSLNYLGDANGWSSIGFYGDSSNPMYYTKGLKINGSPLTTCSVSVPVKKYAFYNDDLLISITLADGCTSIGTKAFHGCNGITGTLTFGTDLATIGSESFENCTGITDVVLNDGLEMLEYKAFYGCSNLESITIPSSLETCNGYVFSSCSKLASVYYAGSVDDWCGINFVSSYSSNPANNTIAKLYVDGNTETYLTEARITASAIGNYAFYNNKELTSVIITSAGSVGTDAFHSCSNLARLEVDPVDPPTTANNNVFWGVTKTIPFYIPAAGASAYADAARWSDFADNRFLFGSCGENLSFVFAEATGTLTISGSGAMTAFGSASAVPWYSFRSDIKSVVLESGVTTIGNYAFYGCNNALFTSISIPEGVTSLGNSAFNGCTHLASVTLPSTLGSIGSSAFHSNAFTSISIPSSVTSIGSYAFKDCSSLESVSLSNITVLNEEVFSNCSALESIALPASLTTINRYAFKDCSSLTSITIPESVTTMTCNNGDHASPIFAGCTSLASVVWNARHCGGFTRVGQYQEYATPFEAIKTNIASFTFGENVEHIPAYLCHGMTGLESITIPASVSSIGAYAFDGCTGITSVASNATIPPTLASGAFSSPSTKKLYLPHSVSVKAAYRAASGWSSFTEANTFPKIVQFSLSGKTGDAIDPQYFDNLTSKASAPSDPADDGYFVFDKWCSDEEGESPFTFASTNITSDLTLYAQWTLNGLVLNENSDNSSAISAYDGLTTNVTMTRSLTNAQYNTFCLPFSLDASQMATAFGAGYDLEELTDVTYDGEVLGLVFTQCEALEAGKPYLLQPANNVSNPSFTGVEIDASTPSDGLDNTFIEFHGVYSPTELTGGNKNLLFLGAGNELFWPSSTGDLKGFRAYFEVKGSAQKAVRARIVKKEDTATGIDQITNDQLPITNKFLRSGQLLILRDGKTYNAQGMLVE